MNNVVTINGRPIGADHPPYVIAELSGNHNGDIERALQILRACKEAGADAVKLQTYTADTMTIDCDRPEFQINGGLWDGNNLYELYQLAQTPWEWHAPLFAAARDLGLTIFSTPFDETAVDFLLDLDVPAFKIASFELVDHVLLRRVAATGKPVILSTGMATTVEIDEAVAILHQAGCRELILLHCVSGYPTPPEASNLCTLPALAARHNIVVGLSDHTLSTATAVGAVALGASVIEKHVTLRRADGGVDSAFSLEPEELAQLVRDCRTVFSALGHPSDALAPCEEGSLLFRRSLFIVADVAEGEVLTEHNLRAIRPGHGLAPKFLPDCLGRRAAQAIPRGTPLRWELLLP